MHSSSSRTRRSTNTSQFDRNHTNDKKESQWRGQIFIKTDLIENYLSIRNLTNCRVNRNFKIDLKLKFAASTGGKNWTEGPARIRQEKKSYKTHSVDNGTTVPNLITVFRRACYRI